MSVGWRVDFAFWNMSENLNFKFCTFKQMVLQPTQSCRVTRTRQHWFDANRRELVMFVDDRFYSNKAKIYCSFTQCFLSWHIPGHFDLRDDTSDQWSLLNYYDKARFCAKVLHHSIFQKRKEKQGGRGGWVIETGGCPLTPKWPTLCQAVGARGNSDR